MRENTLFHASERLFRQMKNFDKSEKELASFFEKLLYSLCNAFRYKEIPQPMKNEEVFLTMYETLRVANFSREQKALYEMDMKNSKLVDECIEYSRVKGHKAGLEEGLEMGRKEGQKESAIEIARNLKAKDIDSRIIADCTGLTIEEVEAL